LHLPAALKDNDNMTVAAAAAAAAAATKTTKTTSLLEKHFGRALALSFLGLLIVHINYGFIQEIFWSPTSTLFLAKTFVVTRFIIHDLSSRICYGHLIKE